MTGRIPALYALSALIATVQLSAQPPDDRLTALRASSKVRLLEAPGPVPMVYVPSAEWRAVRIQKAAEEVYAWDEKQLHLHVPVTLYVLDKEMGERLGFRSYPLPDTDYARGIIRMPDMGPPDQIVFGGLDHEFGHIFAYALKIWSGNQFMNEFVAQIFAAAYLRAEHIDLPPSSQFPPGKSPRYTSLADLDDLYSSVGDDNYIWFQDQLFRLANLIVKDQSLPAVIEKLQAAFPRDHQRRETLEEIDSHLEGILPGFTRIAGPLAGPSTITRINPSACQDTSERGRPSSITTVILVQNDTAAPLVVTRPAGNKYTVSPHAVSTTLQIQVGESMKLPDGTCLMSRDEPTLAVIEKQ
jgi:hypothetical protein